MSKADFCLSSRSLVLIVFVVVLLALIRLSTAPHQPRMPGVMAPAALDLPRISAPENVDEHEILDAIESIDVEAAEEESWD